MFAFDVISRARVKSGSGPRHALHHEVLAVAQHARLSSRGQFDAVVSPHDFIRRRVRLHRAGQVDVGAFGHVAAVHVSAEFQACSGRV